MSGMKFVIELDGHEMNPIPLDYFESIVAWYQDNGYDVEFDISDNYPDYVTVFAIVRKV